MLLLVLMADIQFRGLISGRRFDGSSSATVPTFRVSVQDWVLLSEVLNSASAAILRAIRLKNDVRFRLTDSRFHSTSKVLALQKSSLWQVPNPQSRRTAFVLNEFLRQALGS